MSGVVRQNVARADAALVARPGRAGVVTDRRNNDAPVGFKDRFGYSGCIAARGLSQVRRISAAALAAPAEGGSVRIWRVGLGCSESSVSDREKLVSVNDRSGETLCVATPYVLHMPTDAASAKAQKRMSEKSRFFPVDFRRGERRLPPAADVRDERSDRPVRAQTSRMLQLV